MPSAKTVVVTAAQPSRGRTRGHGPRSAPHSRMSYLLSSFSLGQASNSAGMIHAWAVTWEQRRQRALREHEGAMDRNAETDLHRR